MKVRLNNLAKVIIICMYDIYLIVCLKNNFAGLLNRKTKGCLIIWKCLSFEVCICRYQFIFDKVARNGCVK